MKRLSGCSASLFVLHALWVTGCSPEPSERAAAGVGHLEWETTEKALEVDFGIKGVEFTFGVTNGSPDYPIRITGVHAECGCTVPELPVTPWNVKPGEGGLVRVAVNLRGKMGMLAKSVSVYSDAGTNELTVRILIPDPSRPGMTETERLENLRIASEDRQSIFRGKCAVCHVEPAEGKLHGSLYSAACGICHDGEHRAEMVPDLTAKKKVESEESWSEWIRDSKPGSLMPAFSEAAGGPLSETQISSLIGFLAKPKPKKTAAPSRSAGGVPNEAFRAAWANRAIRLAWGELTPDKTNAGSNDAVIRYSVGVTNVSNYSILLERCFSNDAELLRYTPEFPRQLGAGEDVRLMLEVVPSDSVEGRTGHVIVVSGAGTEELTLPKR